MMTSDHQQLQNVVTGCSTSKHTDYLSHDSDTWILLQEAHDRVTGKDRATRRGPKANTIATHKLPHSGMKVPFAVQTNPKNGHRQVVVTRDVPKGFTVWEPIHFHTFQSEHIYLQFLQELPLHLQCEALAWTHPSHMNKDLFVDITLDEGSFIQESSSSEDINIDINSVAIRDIKAGEFIFMNHTDYLPPPNPADSLLPYSYSDSGITWFDDLRTTAWKRTGLGMGRRNVQNSNVSIGDHHPFESVGIAYGAVALFVLYAAAKFFYRPPSHKYKDDSYYGTSFFYTEKPKLA